MHVPARLRKFLRDTFVERIDSRFGARDSLLRGTHGVRVRIHDVRCALLEVLKPSCRCRNRVACGSLRRSANLIADRSEVSHNRCTTLHDRCEIPLDVSDARVALLVPSQCGLEVTELRFEPRQMRLESRLVVRQRRGAHTK